MGRKKKEVEVEEKLIPDGQEIVGNLSPKDYWEYRTTLTEVSLEKEKMLHLQEKASSLKKEAEIAQLRAHVFLLSNVEGQKNVYEDTKNGAEHWVKSLEERIGFGVKGCIIDDVTYEVRKIIE